jgi:hypothetical protein
MGLVPARAAKAASERNRPACDQPVQHLRGAQRADARDLQQPRGDRLDQHGELGLQLVGLGLEEPDALGGGPQRPHGGLVLQRLGWPGPQAGAVLDLLGGVAAA